MAKVRISPSLVAERLFPGCNVAIVGIGVQVTDYQTIVLEIEGDDVPADARELQVTIHATPEDRWSRVELSKKA